jgi:hypothetical protein
MSGLLKQLASGDVLLYCDQHPLHLTQQRRTGCRWGQVGLVLRSVEDDPLRVFESTRVSPCRDVWLDIPVQGVQIADLRTRLRLYGGEVAVRRLSPRLGKAQIQLLHAFVDAVHGRAFNMNKRDSVRAAHRCNAPGDGSAFFCSELVAEAYQRIGLLPAPPVGLSSNNYIPADFSSSYPAAHLPLHSDFHLESEQLIHSKRTAEAAREQSGLPRISTDKAT